MLVLLLSCPDLAGSHMFLKQLLDFKTVTTIDRSKHMNY